MAYTYKPYSFNGNVIDGSGNISARFRQDDSGLQARPMDPVEATIPGLGDRDVRAQPKGTVLRLAVRLTSATEPNIQAFFAVFSEEAGLVYLLADDNAASPVRWRLACRVIGFERESDKQFVVVLRAADALWQENTLTTDSQLNKNGNTFSFALTNNGNRRTRPKFTISPDSVKTNILDDYKLSVRGFAVNRSPSYLNRVPIDLSDISAANNPFRHSDNLKIGGVSNQLAGAIGAGDTTIAIDTPVGGGLPTGAGIGMFEDDSEQIYWTGNNGSSLTGVVRGIGGTTAVSHADNAVIRESRVLYNADDLHVWLNDAEVKRWLGGLRTNSLRAWVNGSLPGRVKLTAVTAATAGSPANGGSIQFNESVAALPEKGVIAWADELIAYTGLDQVARTVTGIVRAVWGTTAASHATTVPVYGNPFLFVATMGKAKAAAVGLAPIEEKPALQVVSSTNRQWRWGNETDDPDTVFYDRDRPNRPAMWVPRTDNESAIPVRLNSSLTGIVYEEATPGAGKPAIDGLEVRVPHGIEAVANAITHDATIQDILNLEVRGTDKEGLETLLQRYNSANDGAALTLTPAAPLTRLRYSALPTIITGADVEDAEGLVLATAWSSQQFTLDEFSEMWAVLARLKKLDSPDGSIELAVAADAGSDSIGAAVVTGLTIAMADVGTSFTDVVSRLLQVISSGWALLGGSSPTKYWLRVRRTIATVGTVEWARAASWIYAKGKFRQSTGAGPYGPNSSSADSTQSAKGALYSDWSGLANLKTSNDTYASTTPGSNNRSEELTTKTFGFAVGAGETILGIVVEVECKRAGSSGKVDECVLLKAGTPAGDAQAGENIPSSEAYVIVGGQNDLWGTTWTPSDINNANFGVRFEVNGQQGQVIDVDHIRITVYTQTSEILSELTSHFAILGRPQSEAQPEAPTDSGHQVTLDKIILELNDAAGDPWTPYVHRVATNPTNGLYHCVGVIKNNTTGQQIAVDKWMAPGSSLAIDCDARTVIYTEGTWSYPCPSCITPSDLENWLELAPGSNSMQYDELNMVSTDLVTTYRGAKV